MEQKTKETQNQEQIDTYKIKGPCKMGPWTSHIWRSDPRHLAFLLARYKFCAKMLAGKGDVLEIGCGDGFGLPVVLQAVNSVHGIDFEPLVLEDARERMKNEGITGVSYSVFDITKKPLGKIFDAAYSLDVIEHVPQNLENRFMENICKSLDNNAIFIVGTPNITAERYATKASAEGHINLKSADTLKELMQQYFHNVFVFSMNDEVVHTGYYPMAHYLIAMGVGTK